MAQRPGGMPRIGAAVVTLLTAGILIALSLGPAVAQLSPSAGVPMTKRDSELQRVAALTALGAGQDELSQHHARLSLAAMPWNQSSLTIIGQSLSGKRAVAALNLSAALGWRDPLTNVRLFEAAMVEKQPVVAAERADALGRTVGPQVAEKLVDRLLAVPGGSEAFAERAARHLTIGDWVPQYLKRPPASAELADLRADLVKRIDSDDGTWRRGLVAYASHGFALGGFGDRALGLWSQTLADPNLFDGGLYDGRFTTLGSGQPQGGEWGIAAEPAATAEPMADGGLQLTALGGKSGYVFTSHTDPRLLRGGLVAVWKGAEAAVRGFSWDLNCKGIGQIPLQRQLEAVNGQWRDTYRLTLAADCGSAQLALVKTGPSQSEQTLQLISLSSLQQGAGR